MSLFTDPHKLHPAAADGWDEFKVGFMCEADYEGVPDWRGSDFHELVAPSYRPLVKNWDAHEIPMTWWIIRDFDDDDLALIHVKHCEPTDWPEARAYRTFAEFAWI